MGGKQSTSGDVSVIQTPVTESIQDAYKAGDTSKAQELIRLSCEETALQVEKVGLGYCSLSNFIGKDAKISRCHFLMEKICLVVWGSAEMCSGTQFALENTDQERGTGSSVCRNRRLCQEGCCCCGHQNREMHFSL